MTSPQRFLSTFGEYSYESTICLVNMLRVLWVRRLARYNTQLYYKARFKLIHHCLIQESSRWNQQTKAVFWIQIKPKTADAITTYCKYGISIMGFVRVSVGLQTQMSITSMTCCHFSVPDWGYSRLPAHVYRSLSADRVKSCSFLIRSSSLVSDNNLVNLASFFYLFFNIKAVEAHRLSRLFAVYPITLIKLIVWWFGKYTLNLVIWIPLAHKLVVSFWDVNLDAQK